jgi:hypothetical protein
MKRKLILVAVATAILVLVSSPASADLVLRLEASNYDAATGTWTDTSGNDNDATQATSSSRPSTVTSQTDNGSSAVRFDGDDFLGLTTPISSTSDADGFTAFAFLRTNSTSNYKTIFAGSPGSFQYRIEQTSQKQGVIRAAQAALGYSTTALPTGISAAFSSINAQVNNVSGSFRFNGAADGSMTASAFTAAITTIGLRPGSSEIFIGDIAEIRIYNTQLSLSEIMTIEAELTSAYTNPLDPTLPTVDAGENMIAWSGALVPMTPNVTANAEAIPSGTTYVWSIDQASLGDTNLDVKLVDDDTEDEYASVKIAKLVPTGNETIVTMTLTVTVSGKGPVKDTMTIDVYDNACDAAGPVDHKTDFNGDCKTNLIDFAMMAAMWLDGYELTGPAVK